MPLAAALLIAAAPPAIDASLKPAGAPGMQIVVVDHGTVTVDAAYGLKNLAENAPVDVHTRFEIGSITKQFTAAAILQLAEAKKLLLDDPLGKYVPQYVAGRAVTLRQMLWQVSGIPDYTDLPAFQALVRQGATVTLARNGSIDDVLAMLGNRPLAFAPGSKWAYSNSNYVLLGRVVEIVSGMPWDRYIAEHIFKPAGMTESSFMADEATTPDMATGYTMEGGTLHPTGSFSGWAGGAGAIVSTASDVAKWDGALFGGKIVSPADLALMTQPGPVPTSPGGQDRYGFGWLIDRYDGQPRIWHNGGTLGFMAANHVYPQLGQTIVVLDNASGASADEIAQAAFDRLHPELAAAKQRPAAGEDPAVTARAKLLWEGFAGGNLDRTQFTSQAIAMLTPAVLAVARTNFSQLGKATAWIYRGKVARGGQTTYVYLVSFASGTSLHVYMTVGADGKVSGYLAQ